MRLRRVLPVLPVFLFAAFAIQPKADAQRVKEDFHYSYPLTPGGRLNVQGFNGSVQITGWDQNTVDISGTKYAETKELLDQLKIETSASEASVDVRAVRPEGERRGNMGAAFVIKVPRRTELDSIASSNGGIRVEEVEGNAKLRTSNGPIRTVRLRGNVEGRTSNGPVEVREADGAVDLRTSNGPVTAEGVRGVLSIATSNGGIRANLRNADQPVTLTTSNGGVDLDVDSTLRTDVRATTSNGPITVRMPAAMNAQVKATTSSHARITSDFDLTVKGGEIGKSRLDGVIGSGGPLLNLTTSNGPIRLARK